MSASARKAAETKDMNIADRDRKQGAGHPDAAADSSLLPMLIGGLALIVIGMVVVAMLV